jgi:hypothetical protein
MSDLEARITDIDRNGTRSTIGLTSQVANQGADIAEISGKLKEIDAKLDSAARVRFSQYVGFAMALLPVYVLLFLALFHVTPA